MHNRIGAAPVDLTDAEAQSFFARGHVVANHGEMIKLYSDWAPVYDAILERVGIYHSPQRIAEGLAFHLPDRNTLVLDAACGTGLLGAALQSAGFGCVVGIDLSQAMLRQAQTKDCYRMLVAGDLYQSLPFAAGSFGVVTCIGTFTLGHVRSEAVANLLSVLRPGGMLACDIELSTWENYGFRQKFEAMLEAGAISLVAKDLINFLQEPDNAEPQGWLLLARKC